MWMQGVLVVLLSGLSAPGQAQPPRCRVGEQLPVPGPGAAPAPPPRSRCLCVPLHWVRLAAAGAGLALGLLWVQCRRASAPQDLGPPEAALLRDVSGLLRFIRAQLRQLARTERGGAPLLPPRGPPAPRRLLAGLEIGLCSQSQDPQPMALLEGVSGGVTQPPRTTAHLSVRPPGVRE